MKHILFSLLALAISIGQSYASDRIDLLNETFSYVNGSEFATNAVSTSDFDNPSLDWSFTNAYAGPKCIIIKKGGSFTTPPLADLTGNATYYFSIGVWEDPTGMTFPDYENMKPHALSISGGGELSSYEYDSMSSHMYDAMYDVGPQTRITLTADYDIMLSGVMIYYGSGGSSMQMGDFTTYSHEPGDYFTPLDLTMTVSKAPIGDDSGMHNILVYTIDGTEPARTSTRYDGTPLHLSATTTVKTATIFGNGCLYYDKPRTYTFPSSEIPDVPGNTFEVTVTRPGDLRSLLLNLDADVINGLILKGILNGEDLRYLTVGEGRTANIRYVDMSEVEFAYDDTVYRTVVDAPEGGMGTTYTYQYCLSETNYDERLGGSPTNENFRRYRNNLAAAFLKHKTIETVVLPNSLTNIGERIFDRCASLKSVVFPEGMTSVGDLSFYYCTDLEMYDFPSNFETIGARAFAGVKLGNVKFDKRIRLGEGAFQSSTIAKLEMPLSADTIPAMAFAYCSELREISIGEGVRYMGNMAFGYTGITVAQLPESITEMEDNVFYGCPFVNSIASEDGIRYIGKVAYELADRNRVEYTVKDGTVSLSPGLFAFTSATDFNMPSSLEIVGVEAFACTQLTSMPDMPGLKRINSRAFRDCPQLARITIPESVEYIDYPFGGCNALWSVTYNAVDAECPWGLGIRDVERIVVGDKVRRLPAGLYSRNKNVTEVLLPASVEIIDNGAFEECSNLRYVRLSDNVTEISDHAFAYCSALTDIHWPAKLKKIGFTAFRECVSLKTISLPEGLESLDYGAFQQCSGVETLYVPSTITEFGYGALTLHNSDKNITITATAAVPQPYEWSWYYMGTPTIKVPAAYLEVYRTDPNWSCNGRNLIVPIEAISAPTENTITSFGSCVDADTDLADTVIGNVYVTLGEEDGYDETDGAIVLNSIMEEDYVEAVGGMAPGESDIANRFNGLVVQVPAGQGTLTVNCVTSGGKFIAVKFGTGEPHYYSMNSKGDITVEYDVAENTYVYIYACEGDASEYKVHRAPSSAPVSDSCVKIYAIGIYPDPSGIEGIAADGNAQSPIQEYYRIDGSRVDNPTSPGIYIGHRADGTSVKILIK